MRIEKSLIVAVNVLTILRAAQIAAFVIWVMLVACH